MRGTCSTEVPSSTPKQRILPSSPCYVDFTNANATEIAISLLLAALDKGGGGEVGFR